MPLLKISRDALSVRWLDNDAPTDPQDDAGIKGWVSSRERVLKRTAGLTGQAVGSFGMACLLACKGHVVTALQTRRPADLVDLEMWEPDDNPASYLSKASENLDVLLGTTLRLSSEIYSAAKNASAAVRAIDAEALSAEAAVDAMSSEPSSSWVEASRGVADSLAVGFDASQASRDAYQLGSIMMALRMLEWGAGERTFGAYGAAKAAACAVIAAQEAAVVMALTEASWGQGDDAYRRIRQDAGSAELQRQADFLRGESSAV